MYSTQALSIMVQLQNDNIRELSLRIKKLEKIADEAITLIDRYDKEVDNLMQLIDKFTE